jgi:small subunit ribosomal protein S3
MDAGARGCQITIAGKLTGLRHRTEKFLSGHIKFCGEPALELMDVGIAQAKLKPGTIGVKVAIMKPDAVLPAEITIVKPVVETVETEVKEENSEDKKADEVIENPESKEEKSETKDVKKEVPEKKEKAKK